MINQVKKLFELGELLKQPGILHDENPTWLSRYILETGDWDRLAQISSRSLLASTTALQTFSFLGPLSSCLE